MKKWTMRLIAFCLVFGLLFSSAAAQTASDLDYTLEEKLAKQLQAGSGFEGTLTVQADAVAGRESDAWTTIQPLNFAFDYIAVRADAATGSEAESRLVVSFVDGDKTLGTAELSFRAGLQALKSSLLGDGWYTLSDTAIADAAGDGEQATLAQTTQNLLGQAALPGLATFAAGVLARLSGADTSAWANYADPYTTKIDLWIEGFRQSSQINKASDGSTTIDIEYSIPTSAVKAQLKQMVMDLLADEPFLTALAGVLPEEDVKRYLDPSQQNYYFFTIDELPLTGNLKLSRTMSLQGDTLALSLSLPLYDSKGGEATLTYDRRQGVGDLPEENTLQLENDQELLRVNYQTYDTLTGTTVYQGTVLRSPPDTGTFEVGAQDTAAAETWKAFSAAFTFTGKRTEATNAQGQDTVQCDYEFTLSPEYTPGETGDAASTIATEEQAARYVVFSPMTLTLQETYTSGQAKNASTALNMTLTFSGEELPQTVTMIFAGNTKGKWTPDPLDVKAATALDGMSQTALNALLTQAAVKGGLLFLPYIGLPSSGGTATATVSPTETPAP
ncbi:MAG: hypothetical protein LLF96_01040 [Eubacteriales bacterium]|nr:hypothetical protein [Eubacteriales bacterium]